MKKTVICAMVVLVSAGLQAKLIDFNKTGDLTSNFTWAKASQYNEAAARGVAGSGGVTTRTSPNVEATYNTPTVFNKVGDTVTSSIDFQWNSQSGGSSTRTVLMGFSASPGGDLIANSSSVCLEALEGTADNIRLEINVSTYWNQGPTVTLTDKHWYRLSATFELSSESKFTFSVELFGLGIDGTETPVSLATHSGTQKDNNGLVGTELYQYFSAYRPWGGGAVSVDNFNTQP